MNARQRIFGFKTNGVIHRFLFWLRARTRHGTHSPFIYNFLDRALYAQPKAYPAQYRLLRAAAFHFKPASFGAHPADSELASRLRREFPQLREAGPPYDLYVFERPGPAIEQWLSHPEYRHNDTIVFTAGLELPGGRDTWRRVIDLPEVRVSLETWRAGLLFFRKEQAGEHFKIRI